MPGTRRAAWFVAGAAAAIAGVVLAGHVDSGASTLPQLTVAMAPSATPADLTGVASTLHREPGVVSVSFQGSQEAYEEYASVADHRTVIETVQLADLPATFTVRLYARAPLATLELALGREPGVAQIATVTF